MQPGDADVVDPLDAGAEGPRAKAASAATGPSRCRRRRRRRGRAARAAGRRRRRAAVVDQRVRERRGAPPRRVGQPGREARRGRPAGAQRGEDVDDLLGRLARGVDDLRVAGAQRRGACRRGRSRGRRSRRGPREAGRAPSPTATLPAATSSSSACVAWSRSTTRRRLVVAVRAPRLGQTLLGRRAGSGRWRAVLALVLAARDLRQLSRLRQAYDVADRRRRRPDVRRRGAPRSTAETDGLRADVAPAARRPRRGARRPGRRAAARRRRALRRVRRHGRPAVVLARRCSTTPATASSSPRSTAAPRRAPTPRASRPARASRRSRPRSSRRSRTRRCTGARSADQPQPGLRRCAGPQPTRYAYLGPDGHLRRGGAAHAAGRGAEASSQPCAVGRAALDAVRRGEADARARAVRELRRGLGRRRPSTSSPTASRCMIAREVLLPVSFALLARPGTALADVRPSPPTRTPRRSAGAGCATHAARRAVRAGAVDRGRRAARSPTAASYDAAVAAPIAAERYGLEVLADDIARQRRARVTRFVARRPARARRRRRRARTGRRWSLFIADDHPGALLEMLTEFAVRGVNLTRIESRPTGERARPLLLLDRLRGPRRRGAGRRGARRAAPDLRRRPLPRLLPARLLTPRDVLSVTWGRGGGGEDARGQGGLQGADSLAR